MARYLNPRIDLIFKKIFGQHPNILLSFLNGILPLPEGQFITELAYLPTEQVPVIQDFKNNIADVKCTDNKGNIFIVEMQIRWTPSFPKRLLFGASRAYSCQIDAGGSYQHLKPVIAIGLIDGIMEPGNDNWYHYYRIKHDTMPDKTLDDLQILMIELPKFKAKTREEKKLRLLWLRFLSELDERMTEVPEEWREVPEIAEALSLAEEAAYTPAELESYYSYWDNISMQRTFLDDTKVESHAEGKAEGLAEGIEKGMEKGMEKGRSEEKLDVARNLLAADVPLETIAGATQLSIETIKQLASKQKTD